MFSNAPDIRKVLNEIEIAKIESSVINPPELKRTYYFPNNQKVSLNDVCELTVRPSGSHRLKTSDGKYHIIPIGWIHIELDIEGWQI